MVPERVPPSPEFPQGAFGISGVFDAFTIAFMTPNLFRRLFGRLARCLFGSQPLLLRDLR